MIKSNNWKKMLFALAIICSLFVIVFSQHRSSIIGLVIGSIPIIIWHKSKYRFITMVFIILIGTVGVVSVNFNRLAKVNSNLGIVESLTYDLNTKSRFSRETNRTLEQKFALETFIENPIFGVGTWGKYNGYNLPWQDIHGDAAYETVHNGFLQIGFKSGLIGLLLLVTLFFSHIRNCIYSINNNQGWYKVTSIATLGTFIAMLPNITIGMIMIQLRGLLIIALLILVPIAINNQPKITGVETK